MDRNGGIVHIIGHIYVALRKESVDRNLNEDISIARFKRSLSARRAWIEMLNLKKLSTTASCRSPQGERG